MRRLPLAAAVAAALIYLVFPVLVVVAISFSAGRFLTFPPPGLSLRWYRAMLADPEWTSAFLVTLKIGGLAALIATLIGVPAAYALARHVIPAKALVSAIVMGALVTPPIVTAVATYLYFVPLGLTDSIFGLACAHAASGVPFVVINAAASLRSSDASLERAAMIHGAPPWRAVLGVTLPLVWPGILIGALLAFVHSAHELMVAIFVLGGVGRPFSVKMWSDVQSSSDPTIAAASTVLIGLAILTFASAAAAQALLRRRRS